jgi:hypothetical protein
MWKLIKPWLVDLYKQLFSTYSKRTGKLILTRLATARMHEYGLTEADVENAFRFGKEVKDGMLIQRFQHYQVGLTYKEAEKPDEYLIITCWRR